MELTVFYGIICHQVQGMCCTTVSATDCPSLWTVFQDSCYLFGHQHLSFVEAEQYCRQHNSHLVHIETAYENDFLKSHINDMKETNWWIGLTDDDLEGHWIWYGTNESPTFTDWEPTQPDDAQGKEDCVEFRLFSRKWAWNDGQCDINRISSICELIGNKGPQVIG